MLTRKENMTTVIANRDAERLAEKIQKCRKATGKNALMHNKFFWTEVEKAIMMEGTPKEIYDLGQEIFKGPKYLTLNQLRTIRNANTECNLGLDMDEIKRWSAKEAYDFIGGPLKEMTATKRWEIKCAGPISDFQKDEIIKMSLCVSIKVDFDVNTITYGEAYDFIGKNRDTFEKFKKAQPSPNLVKKANDLFAYLNGGSTLTAETIAAFVDPENPEFANKLMKDYIEQLQSEKARFDRSTTLEPERKERTIEDEEDEEVKEAREIDRIVYNMYQTIGEEVPCDLVIKDIDDLRDIGMYVKTVNDNKSPVMAFRKCKYFSVEEIAYITDATVAYVEKCPIF